MKLTHLNHLGIVRISGSDAESFLQRQFTNDMRELTSEQCGYSAYLNPKGRIIANFLIYLNDDSYYLVLSASLVESFVKRLRMFVIRDRVDISAETNMQVTGLLDEELSERLFPTPKEQFHALTESSITYLRIPGDSKRTIIIGERADIDRYPDQFDDDLRHLWNRLDITFMIPLINRSISEQLVLQAVNLDLLGAVSFTKGCYPGQEIVARLHYKGGVNKRMFQATVAGKNSIESGDLVYCDDIPGNQTGTVIGCSRLQNDKVGYLLVSLPLKFVGHKDLRLNDGTQIELLFDSMPYSIPELNSQ